jgi:hypothetical protein
VEGGKIVGIEELYRACSSIACKVKTRRQARADTLVPTVPGAGTRPASLESLGYTIAGQAEDGETALQKVEEAQLDPVLMEIRLRGWANGIELAAEGVEKDEQLAFLRSRHRDGVQGGSH